MVTKQRKCDLQEIFQERRAAASTVTFILGCHYFCPHQMDRLICLDLWICFGVAFFHVINMKRLSFTKRSLN